MGDYFPLSFLTHYAIWMMYKSQKYVLMGENQRSLLAIKNVFILLIWLLSRQFLVLA